MLQILSSILHCTRHKAWEEGYRRLSALPYAYRKTVDFIVLDQELAAMRDSSKRKLLTPRCSTRAKVTRVKNLESVARASIGSQPFLDTIDPSEYAEIFFKRNAIHFTFIKKLLITMHVKWQHIIINWDHVFGTIIRSYCIYPMKFLPTYIPIHYTHTFMTRGNRLL